MTQIIWAAIALLAVIVIAMLKWDMIVDWFYGRRKLDINDQTLQEKLKGLIENGKYKTHVLEFSLQEKLADGKFKTVQGIFDKMSNELVDGVVYESKELDEKLAELHRKDELVVYS